MFGITRSPIDFFGGSWTPASLATLRQWLADNYYSSPVGGLQVIESLEPHGTVRAPQPGCCALFDGVNDKGATAARISPVGDFTFSCRIEPNSVSGVRCVATEYLDTTNTAFFLGTDNASVEVYFYTSVSDWSGQRFANAISLNTKLHVLVTLSGTTISVYLNGVLASPTTSPSNGAFTGMSATSIRYLEIGGIGSGNYFDGKIWDARGYSVAKTAPEVADIAACDFTNLDKTGIVAGWYLNDRAGTTARDWSGNGHDLTLSGPITESTFWAEDSAITANPANVLGYTLSGSTVIPRDESDPTKDVQGNALGNTGLSPYPVTIDTPCIKFNGTSDYATSAGNNWQFAGDFTISLRVKFTAYGTYIYILGSANDGGITTGFWLEFGSDRGFTLYTNSAVLILDDNLVSLTALATNTWYHILVTRLGSGTNNVKGYIDGVVFGQASSNATIGNTILPLMIGDGKHNHGGFGLNGSLADVKIWTSGADATEVTAIANGASTLGTPLGSWCCQEGPGTSNTNVTLYDDSGNGNHLTVVGGTVADQWDNLCPGYVKDHAFEYGGRLDALGAFCPLVPGTALCADGNAATIAAGNITGNPYSRVDFDPFDAAELGALNVPGEFDSLPCVTLNGSTNYVSITTFTLVGDFDSTCYFYTANTFGGIWGNATNGLYLDTLSTLRFYVAGALNQYLCTVALNAWHKVRVVRVGSTIDVYLDDVQLTQNVNNNLTGDVPITQLGKGFGTFVLNGRASSFTFTNAGTTKLFPLTDGSGDDIAMYEDGVATIITNAIQGTITNVWDNKTEGKVDHTFPEATRAIVPRDTKFTNGSTKTITTSEPATGADLTNILEYME